MSDLAILASGNQNVTGRKPGTWNSASAKIASDRASQARKIKFAERAARVEAAKAGDSDTTRIPAESTRLLPEDPFTRERLFAVRAQLKRLDVMMQTETDPQKLDRIASAQAKLAEQERQLAGRPLPGSLRPSNRPSAGGMIEQPQTSAPSSSSTPPVQSEAQE